MPPWPRRRHSTTQMTIASHATFPSRCWTRWNGTAARRCRLATMLVLDALFGHIQQISSNVEITGSLHQFAKFRQLAAGAGDGAYIIDQGRSFLHVETDAFNRQTRTTGISGITCEIDANDPTADIRPHELLKSVAYQFSQGRKVVPLRLGVQFAFGGLPATSLFNPCHQNSTSGLNNQKTGSRRNCSLWIVGNQPQQNRNGRR
jgi:hypothetical protein